jgi:hypothetical protein
MFRSGISRVETDAAYKAQLDINQAILKRLTKLDI